MEITTTHLLPPAPPVGTVTASRVAVPAIGSSADEDTAAVLAWSAIWNVAGFPPGGGRVTPRAHPGAGTLVSPLGHEQLATDQATELDAVVATWLHDAGHCPGGW